MVMHNLCQVCDQGIEEDHQKYCHFGLGYQFDLIACRTVALVA
jgi:hypothetical protein